MEVTVLWFGVLRERRGVDREVVALHPGETIAALYARLVPPPSVPVAFAIDHQTVPGSTVLRPGAELVFLPPVGGG